ncbi:MAG TPA: hypothetical protein VK783_05575 [Bacteroidia bacterium]|jgi:3-deoxy-D-arabino-heptulosonate 7-phosphate (DAHP) synthase|nr:hypothetical protein [Bacteroidia bacterium]
MEQKMKNTSVALIAGPCSISEKNITEVYSLADMQVKNRFGETQRAVTGVRIVGVKSRTSYIEKEGAMGIDREAFVCNLRSYAQGGSIKDMKMLPSITMSEEFIRKTGLMVATEIVAPLIQVPLCDQVLRDHELLLWTPAVLQIGWNLMEMYECSKKNAWKLGIKNPKWVGKESDGLNSMEKTWLGIGTYVPQIHDIIYIHRGVDVAETGLYRNLPVHESAKKVKKLSGKKMYFDPSHTFGPKMKDKIVDGTLEAMKMMSSADEYLYDGILIEAGTSLTDTEQHITHAELQKLINELSKFRDIVEPKEKKATSNV